MHAEKEIMAETVNIHLSNLFKHTALHHQEPRYVCLNYNCPVCMFAAYKSLEEEVPLCKSIHLTNFSSIFEVKTITIYMTERKRQIEKGGIGKMQTPCQSQLLLCTPQQIKKEPDSEIKSSLVEFL